MTVPRLALGFGAGLLLALVLAPATGNAIGELAKARAERTMLAGEATVPDGQAVLVAPDLTLPGGATALEAAVRERARNGGVLVEEIAQLPTAGSIVAVRLRASGNEKAVLALADGLERQAPLIRLRTWRLEPTPDGGVRLIGEAVAVTP